MAVQVDFMKITILKFIFPLLAFSTVVVAEPIKVVFLGDSVTAGYGVAKENSYPALLQKKLIKKHPGLEVVNAGISGATTASAIANLKWQLRRPFQVLVLCLGGNDGLRGLKVENSEKNLSKVISMAQEKKIKILLIGMKIPENYGADYGKKFEAMYPRLAKKYKTTFMPFLLKDVATEKSLNLPDGIHPNEKGYEKVADNVLPYLERLL